MKHLKNLRGVRDMSLAIVQSVRQKYGTPLGGKHADFLLDLAVTLGSGAGLLRKPTGTVIWLPDGTSVAQDIICYPDGRIFDCLTDGEGAAAPRWAVAGGSPVSSSRYYLVTAGPLVLPTTHAYDGGENDTGLCDICGQPRADTRHTGTVEPPITPPTPNELDLARVLLQLAVVQRELQELREDVAELAMRPAVTLPPIVWPTYSGRAGILGTVTLKPQPQQP